MITIGTRVETAQRAGRDRRDAYDDVYFTVGAHPHEAASEAASDFAAMRRLAAHPKCVGIGEAGLDYHYNYAPPEVAKAVFRGQIALARELGLPLVIHTRDAEADTAAILKEEMGQGAVQRRSSTASPRRGRSPKPRSTSAFRSPSRAW